jgi:hypothetical protein
VPLPDTSLEIKDNKEETASQKKKTAPALAGDMGTNISLMKSQ